jgi:predicted HicB family RNase H-like nuclease
MSLSCLVLKVTLVLSLVCLGKHKIGRARITYVINNKEGVTSPKISLRLPVKLHKLAKKIAKQKGISLSDLTRLALEKYLA